MRGFLESNEKIKVSVSSNPLPVMVRPDQRCGTGAPGPSP
ncbi:hypothetical protein BJ928_1011363 [Rhizobium sp. WW_1]|nr:hypothetical protein BJ928_1011363 [Rhizobium sp. WW_1]